MMRCGLSWLLLVAGLWGQGASLPQGPHHAVVVGLNDYHDKTLTRLLYPEADARAVAAALGKAGWTVTLVLMNEEQKPSSKATVLGAIREAAGRCPTTGTLLVYFSGHGGKSAKKSYLFAYETLRDSLPTTGIAVGEIEAILSDGGRLRSALIVDACRDPVGGSKPGSRSSPDGARWTDLTLSFGHIAYFGTSDGQTSDEPRTDVKLDGKSVRHGYFTHFLLEGMASVSADTDGDGFVGIQELEPWIKVRMHDLRQQNITQQVPVIRKGDGTGDLILVRAARDKTAPKVTLTRPADQATVLAGRVAFEGTVTDDGVVAEVILRLPGGKKIPLRPEGSTWKTTEELEPGVKEFSVQAGDKAGNWSDPIVSKVVVRALVDDPIPTPGTPNDTSVVRRESPRNPQSKRFSGLTFVRANQQGFDEYTLDKDPSVVLIRIPGGMFTMGSTDEEAFFSEKPLTRVTLSPYFIAKHETTWAQYEKFCEATSRALPAAPSFGRQGQHPVVNVSFENARAYCAWAGLTLPTEAQWEYAARGPEGRKWPWGSTSPDSDRTLANGRGSEDGFESTAPVGSFPRGVGPFGTLDQAGNVWEWCADVYAAYPGGSVTDPKGPPGDSAALRVYRGGGWGNSARDLRGASRCRYSPSVRVDGLGFRPALVAP